ncbi:hypothetical protein LNP25_21315 [Klebsiella variicola subsp. variicola]|nr:hypothetical protein [Klebsiella variicola subsp. variicola]
MPDDRHPAPESGAFYARLRHERYLNGTDPDAGHHQLPDALPGAGAEGHRRRGGGRGVC